MTKEQLHKIAHTVIHQDGTTFEEMFHFLNSDGFFWINGEPADGEEEIIEVMHQVLQKLVSAIKEQQ